MSRYKPPREQEQEMRHYTGDYVYGSIKSYEDEKRWRNEFDSKKVVVIDPEDIKTVRRLWEAYENELRGSAFAAEAMQAALRSLPEPPKPPKPDEPLGLGAVVEEANGLRWVRVDTAHSDPMPWMANPSTTFQEAAWADFDAVTVLSPGVPGPEPLADWERDLRNLTDDERDD